MAVPEQVYPMGYPPPDPSGKGINAALRQKRAGTIDPLSTS
jgi:hypothetical protein